MRLSFVFPVYNEEQILRDLYHKIASIAQSITVDFEMIFIDDGSTDNSPQVIRDIHQNDSRVKMISFTRNFGHQIALTAGLMAASGDAVISMDSDLQHPVTIIPELVAQWRMGYEIVYTVRSSTENVNLFKKITSLVYYKLFQVVANQTMPVSAADFRLLDKKVVACLRKFPERHRFLRGMIPWIGYKSIGVHFNAGARIAGESKYNIFKMFHLAMDGIVSFSVIPVYLALYMAILFTLLTFFYFCYITYAVIFTDRVLPGWISLIAVVLLVGGVQFYILALIGLYVGKIFEEVKHRPLFVVRETLGLAADDVLFA